MFSNTELRLLFYNVMPMEWKSNLLKLSCYVNAMDIEELHLHMLNEENQVNVKRTDTDRKGHGNNSNMNNCGSWRKNDKQKFQYN